MHDSTNSNPNPDLSAAKEEDLSATGEGHLPDRLDAGDGHGEYVYKRRGPFGRLRARARGVVQAWLAEAVPRDAEHPPQPGTATYVLAGTWRRRAMTLSAAAVAGVALSLLVLVGL